MKGKDYKTQSRTHKIGDTMGMDKKFIDSATILGVGVTFFGIGFLYEKFSFFWFTFMILSLIYGGIAVYHYYPKKNPKIK